MFSIFEQDNVNENNRQKYPRKKEKQALHFFYKILTSLFSITTILLNFYKITYLRRQFVLVGYIEYSTSRFSFSYLLLHGNF